MAGEPDPDRMAEARRRLFAARAQRVPPGRDDKVLASWNGLACRALAEAGRALERADWVRAAIRNADFVLSAMRRDDGRLLRTWKARAGTAERAISKTTPWSPLALLALYEATFQRRWLDEARALADAMLALFWDSKLEGFYDTGLDHEPLIVRPRNLYDNAVPCGSSVAIEALLRLAVFTGDARYESIALTALRPMADLMARHGGGFGRFLAALDFHLGPVVEVALVSPSEVDLPPLAAEVFGRYLPNRVVAGMAVSDAGAAAAGIPLLEGRSVIDGRTTAYVCRHYACQLPVTDRDDLARLLDEWPREQPPDP